MVGAYFILQDLHQFLIEPPRHAHQQHAFFLSLDCRLTRGMQGGGAHGSTSLASEARLKAEDKGVSLEPPPSKGLRFEPM